MDNWLKHQKEVQKADFENTKLEEFHLFCLRIFIF